MSSTSTMKSTVPSQSLDHGHAVVGVAAAVISARKDLKFLRGVTLYANVSNANNIWIGNQSVTANNAVGTGGFILTPGSSVDVEAEEMRNIFAISDGAAQDLMWIGV